MGIQALCSRAILSKKQVTLHVSLISKQKNRTETWKSVRNVFFYYFCRIWSLSDIFQNAKAVWNPDVRNISHFRNGTTQFECIVFKRQRRLHHKRCTQHQSTFESSLSFSFGLIRYREQNIKTITTQTGGVILPARLNLNNVFLSRTDLGHNTHLSNTIIYI